MRIVGESAHDYRRIFVSNAPLLDLRAPVEFAKGAFGNATNLPLMTNDERAKVGTCYKRNGREAAITLGYQLVSGEIREQRVQQWVNFAEQNPHGYLYCFRGGLRSQTVQRWLRERQVDYPLIEGGYKAMRRYLLDETERITTELPLYVVSGLTGTGKTPLLLSLPNTIDLEGLANHRGSSFGGNLTPQPSQIDFENELAAALVRLDADGSQRLILEDESRLIGSRSVPLQLHRKMKYAPLIILKVERDSRIENILQEYVVQRVSDYQSQNGEGAIVLLQNYLSNSIGKLRKRLGTEKYLEVERVVQMAIREQQSQNSLQGHRQWIRMILEDYYDPMYEYQLSKKRKRVIFEGDSYQVREYVLNLPS